MPNLDKTGPMGQGPLTGRGMGYCGQGYGYGQGRGCCGRRFYTKAEEKELLAESVKNLKEDLRAAEERLKDISA